MFSGREIGQKNQADQLSALAASFTAPFVTTSGEDIEDRDAARAPDWAGNIGFGWDTPMSEALELGLSGNMAFSSSYFTNEDSSTDFREDGYVTFDASISVGDPDGLWRLSLVGVNLTDEIWVNTSGGRPFLPVGGDDQVLTQNRGRQVFVRAAFNF